MSDEQQVPADVACASVVEVVTDYLEGALDQETAAAVEYHLTLCAACDLYLEQMRTTIQLLGRVPVETLTPTARDDLLAAFRDFHAASGPRTGADDTR